MKNKSIEITEDCPFCSHQLTDDPEHCTRCGAELKKAYIDRVQRRCVFISRLVLLVISSLGFFYFQPTSGGDIAIGLYALSILLSLVVPYFYFKFKNKNRDVWIRKPLSW